jgi:spore coat protein A, manganese oxidase
MKRLSGWRGIVCLTSLACLVGGISSVAFIAPAPIDFSGDNRSDFAIVRNTGGGPSGAITWWVSNAATSAATNYGWGIASDFFIPGDFDGDGLEDPVIWRSGAVGTAGCWVRQSSNGAAAFIPWGQAGDDPTVIGDYDGDGKIDCAVYRGGVSSGQPSYWWYKRSSDGGVGVVQWGQNGDFPAPGDYNGDGVADMAIQRNAGGGNANFYIRLSTGAISVITFGTPTDVVVPGDYDGDGITDIATVRGLSGNIIWWVRSSATGTATPTFFGASATDFPVQGDYDGDNKTDIAVFRPSATPGATQFFVLRSNGAGMLSRAWGQNGDYPVANYNAH